MKNNRNSHALLVEMHSTVTLETTGQFPIKLSYILLISFVNQNEFKVYDHTKNLNTNLDRIYIPNCL